MSLRLSAMSTTLGDAMEPEETGIELLLSEPEIVAWLEPTESESDHDDPPKTGNP